MDLINLDFNSQRVTMPVHAPPSAPPNATYLMILVTEFRSNNIYPLGSPALLPYLDEVKMITFITMLVLYDVSPLLISLFTS